MAKNFWPDWDIYIRDKCICQYCGLDGKNDIKIWRQLQIDHLIPIKLGGSNKPENKVVACARCNHLKGYRDPRQKLPKNKLANPKMEDLIQGARELIDQASIRMEEEKDYELMKSEINKS